VRLIQRHWGLRLFLATVASVMTYGCSTPPAPKPPPEPPKFSNAPLPLRSAKQHQVTLGDGIVLDYQIEQKLSRVNAKACFAYITGVVYNRSKEGISKKSGLDVIVISQGKQLFRDQTYPVGLDSRYGCRHRNGNFARPQ